VGLRETLHILELQKPSKTYDVAISLFGINPLFGLNAVQGPSLLERLHSVGTLFIKNVEFLDRESQENLALLIRCGYYTIFKGDQKIFADVKIICSSKANLADLVRAGTFSKALFHELHTTKISMPSMATLSEQELYSLAEGFTLQSLTENDIKHLLLLTEKDKKVLSVKRPLSLEELKEKVQDILLKKAKKNMLSQEGEVTDSDAMIDPELIAAARLGKQALKDERIMTLLWNKFQSQNKISAFLGVNRSSVNRRCKEYNLL
jgi:transcriptional regulator of aroF, aroG, tyrA and aromatic amino acid transport